MSNSTLQQTLTLPLDRLDAHPANSNVMPKALLDKLARSIERTGFYPPIIVRPIGERYQILDGHHRVLVLKQLGETNVNVVVWQADDEQSLILLATLNRMRGEDDPRKRAALLTKLGQSMDIKELAKRLPEDSQRVQKMLSLHAAPPSPKAPRPIDQMPVNLHFFMLPQQRSAVEARLREHGGTREAALLNILGINGEHTNDK